MLKITKKTVYFLYILRVASLGTNVLWRCVFKKNMFI